MRLIRKSVFAPYTFTSDPTVLAQLEQKDYI
jgi:hypothetical protein